MRKIEISSLRGVAAVAALLGAVATACGGELDAEPTAADEVTVTRAALNSRDIPDGDVAFIDGGPSGRVVAVWFDYFNLRFNSLHPAIWARVFDGATMAPLTPARQLTQPGDKDLAHLQVVVTSNSELFIAYNLIYSTTDYDVRGLWVDQNLNVIVSDFSINASGNNHPQPRIAYDPGSQKVLLAYDEFVQNGDGTSRNTNPVFQYVTKTGASSPFVFGAIPTSASNMNDVVFAQGKFALSWYQGAGPQILIGSITPGATTFDTIRVLKTGSSEGNAMSFNPITQMFGVMEEQPVVGGAGLLVESVPFSCFSTFSCPSTTTRVWTDGIGQPGRVVAGSSFTSLLSAFVAPSVPNRISVSATGSNGQNVASSPGFAFPAGCSNPRLMDIASGSVGGTWVAFTCRDAIWAQRISNTAAPIGAAVKAVP
jgi:hypothetical protein